MRNLANTLRVVVLGALLCAVAGLASCQKEEEMAIADGTTVAIEYTLKLDDQTVVDTNVGSDPLTYTHGSREIIPGLERELEGLKVGDTKKVTVPPEQAYGAVDPGAIQEVPKEQIPPDALQVGAQLQGRDPAGRVVRGRVVEVREETVLVDFNHPLAGKTLFFEVKVLDIQPPPVQ